MVLFISANKSLDSKLRTVEMSHTTSLGSGSNDSPRKDGARKEKRLEDDDDDIFSLGSRDSRKKRKKKKKALREDWEPEPLKVEKEEPIEPKESKEPKQEVSERTMDLLSDELDPQDEDNEEDHEIIVLDDEEEEEVIPRESGGRTLRRLTRATAKSSPTLVRKPASTAATGTEAGTGGGNKGLETEEPEELNDDLNDEDEYFNDIMKSIRDIQTDRELFSTYEFTDANEMDRPYLIDVLPKIYTDRPTRFTTKGTKIFGGILLVILQHYKKLGLIPASCKPADFSLFWIQGRREIKSFFKPSTLRITPPPEKHMIAIGDIKYTRIHCLLVPKDSASQALDIYEELKPKSASFGPPDLDYLDDIEEIENKEDEFDDKLKKELDEYIEKERLQNMTEGKSGSPGNEVIDLDEEAEECFTIGLKGKDNKRVEIKVSPRTKLENVLDYYLKQLGIEKSTVNKKTAKLVFDDEPLDLQDTVGNTELEQDFEVQVYL